MRSGRWGLLPRYPAAHCIQIQSAFLGHFNRGSNPFAQERWNDNSALLDIQHNRAPGCKMKWDLRPSLLGFERADLFWL